MPKLIVIAGCNGAGKSVFASSFLPNHLVSFDYDKLFLAHYNSMPDSEWREEIAKNQTSKDFEAAVENALIKKKDFCYETNFDTYPVYWPKIFKEKGYQINLIFFCLTRQAIARHRIQVRTEFKGHFVDDKTIDLKWKAGYKNVNLHFEYFDNVLFVDNSKQNVVYNNILQIEGCKIELMADSVPNYFKHRLPAVQKLIISI